MIVRKFLAWAQSAPSDQRADGVRALARAFLYGHVPADELRLAEIAFTTLLDDPSPQVRQALAESFAQAPTAPHHVVAALANDQSDIAAIVLSRSPLLTDAELIDCAAIGDAFAQSAIALRPRLSANVSAALAEVGAREALISLAVNTGADLPEFSMMRMLERFGDDGELREALLDRSSLSATMRAELVAATARALSDFVVGCEWLSGERASRVTREAREKATVLIAGDVERDRDHATLRLVAHLRSAGQLTPGLVLRALLSGNRSLFEAALCELSGLKPDKVAGLVRNWKGTAFAALYARAQLPAGLLVAFRAALAAQDECGAPLAPGAELRLSRVMVERVLTACEHVDSAELAPLLSVLRRLEGEALREEAREAAGKLAIADAPASAAARNLSIDLAAIEAEMLLAA